MRIQRLALLEPKFRRQVEAVLDELGRRQIPLSVYETVRSPSRQEALYARGRDHGLKPLTFERPHVQTRAFDLTAMDRGPADDARWLEWIRERNAEPMS